MLRMRWSGEAGSLYHLEGRKERVRKTEAMQRVQD